MTSDTTGADTTGADNTGADLSDDLDIIRAIVKGSRVALLTTVSESGELHARPLAVLENEFAGEIWFFTADPSPKTADIALQPQVNVSMTDGKSYLSLAGTASVVRDRDRIDELWSPMAEAWFENGRDDPSVALLRVDASSAEFWAIDKPALARAFQLAKGIVTGRQPDVGENRTVAL
jgi:general stress protein 26